MGGVPEQIWEMLKTVLALEGGTWGGRINLLLLIIVIVTIIPLNVFKLIAEVVRAFVAKWGGDPNPGRFLSEPTPTRKIILVILFFFVASFFTVWLTENIHAPFQFPKKPANKQHHAPRRK